MRYADKLRDPRWQRKRLEVMQRDDWRCVSCGASDKTLNVHHERYAGEPWDVPSEFLRTLCEDCHRAEHQGDDPEPPSGSYLAMPTEQDTDAACRFLEAATMPARLNEVFTAAAERGIHKPAFRHALIRLGFDVSVRRHDDGSHHFYLEAPKAG